MMNLNDEKSNSYSRRSNRESIVDVSRMSSSEIGIKLYDCIVDHQYNSFREIWKQIDECNGQTTIKKPKDKHSKSMSTGGTRLSSIVSKISKNRINVNEILNNKRYTPEKIPLIYAVVVNGEDADLLDILLNHGADVNRATKANETPLYAACCKNNFDMVQLLMQQGADPNIVTTKLETTMSVAAWSGNSDIMAELLNLSKQYKHSFHWNNLINQVPKDGLSVFHAACQKGKLECIDFLSEIQQRYRVKIDKYIKSGNQYKATPLLLACINSNASRDNIETIKYLIENIYKSNKQDIINQAASDGKTPLFLCCTHGNLEVIKFMFEIYGNQIDIDTVTDLGITILHAVCQSNRFQCLKWLLNDNEYTKHRLAGSINVQDKKGYTPLMRAIISGSEECVAVLCDYSEQVCKTIRHIVDKDSYTPFQLSVCYGNTAIFSKLLLKFIETKGINDMKSFWQSKILTIEDIDKYITWCEPKHNWGLFAFLLKFKEKCLIANDFGLLLSYLENSCVKYNGRQDEDRQGSGNDETVKKLYNSMRKDEFVANYLFSRLKKESLVDIAKVVTNGISNYECGFNDSLMFLSKLVNEDQFNQMLKNVTTECLNNNKIKNIKRATFFENNLINSNIWTITANVTQFEAEEDIKSPDGAFMKRKRKQKQKQKQQQELEQKQHQHDKEKGNDSSCEDSLFDEIRRDAIEKELVKQKDFIKYNIVKLERKFEEQFEKLKEDIRPFNLGIQGEVTQNSLKCFANTKIDFMKLKGIQTKYSIADLTSDNETDYNGKEDYNFNGYLTDLLVLSENANPVFQRECKEYFEQLSKTYRIKCNYSSGPVKTREKCIAKTKSDHWYKKWPSCGHLLDLVRCSVTFDTIDDFLKGFDYFYKDFETATPVGRELIDNYDYNFNYNGTCTQCRQGCLRGIARIENDFAQLKDDEVKSRDVNSFEYFDIRCNMIIDYNDKRMIGEIKFVLQFMLDSKQQSHLMHSFLRKAHIFGQLNDLMGIGGKTSNVGKGGYNYEQVIIFRNLRKHILARNLKPFSICLENVNLKDKYYVLKYKSVINGLLEQNQWMKGLQLFHLVIDAWEAQNDVSNAES